MRARPRCRQARHKRQEDRGGVGNLRELPRRLLQQQTSRRRAGRRTVFDASHKEACHNRISRYFSYLYSYFGFRISYFVFRIRISYSISFISYFVDQRIGTPMSIFKFRRERPPSPQHAKNVSPSSQRRWLTRRASKLYRHSCDVPNASVATSSSIGLAASTSSEHLPILKEAGLIEGKSSDLASATHSIRKPSSRSRPFWTAQRQGSPERARSYHVHLRTLPDRLGGALHHRWGFVGSLLSRSYSMWLARSNRQRELTRCGPNLVDDHPHVVKIDFAALSQVRSIGAELVSLYSSTGQSNRSRWRSWGGSSLGGCSSRICRRTRSTVT